jgi:hypothetical protein
MDINSNIELKIAFFADNDVTDDAKKVLDTIMKEHDIDQYIFGGDGPYDEQGSEWVSMMQKYFDDTKKTKLIISQGNHEHEESEREQEQQAIENWMLTLKDTPEVSDDQSWEKTRWLTAKQVGNIYIISMNSQDMDIEFKRNQYNWVMKQLEIAKDLRKTGKIDWIFVVIHKPWFTLKSSQRPCTAVRQIYSPKFAEYGVDFLLHGHNHNTQLWLPMIAVQGPAGKAESKQLFEKLSDGTFDFAKPHGQFFIISGHGGHKHTRFREKPSQNPNIIYANDKDYGYTLISVSWKQCTVQSKDINGQILHEFKVSRGLNTQTSQKSIV